jgi:hypothetical protein
VSDPIVIERLSVAPILIEPLMDGALSIIAISTMPGPFGPVALQEIAIDLIVDGQGAAILPGVKADIPINWAGTISGWKLVGDQTGSCVVDILKGDPVHAVPYASIVGGSGPSMTTVEAAEGGTVGWATDIEPGDILRFQVVSISSIRRLTVALFVERA